MKIIKDGLHLRLICESAGEAGALGSFIEGRVLLVGKPGLGGLVLQDLGDRDAACRIPINITRSVEPRFAAISNLAATPFLLDDAYYASVEGFWQSLKFDGEAARKRVGQLAGSDAKKAGDAAQPGLAFDYHGDTVQRGTFAHWQLMRRACLAKFTDDARARKALLASGQRPLTHVVPNDSRTIPGVIMADIWMKIRADLQND